MFHHICSAIVFPTNPVSHKNCVVLPHILILYFLFQIVSKYGKDRGVTAMLDKMNFVIMPVLNVDGYVFSWNKVGTFLEKYISVW